MKYKKSLIARIINSVSKCCCIRYKKIEVIYDIDNEIGYEMNYEL
jgi:hypothetical protein